MRPDVLAERIAVLAGVLRTGGGLDPGGQVVVDGVCTAHVVCPPGGRKVRSSVSHPAIVHTELLLLALVVGSLAVTWVCRRFDVSAPLVLVVVGIAASFIPGVETVQFDPNVVLFAVLTPLLYSSALESSFLGIRQNLRPIGLLAVGSAGVQRVRRRAGGLVRGARAHPARRARAGRGGGPAGRGVGAVHRTAAGPAPTAHDDHRRGEPRQRRHRAHAVPRVRRRGGGRRDLDPRGVRHVPARGGRRHGDRARDRLGRAQDPHAPRRPRRGERARARRAVRDVPRRRDRAHVRCAGGGRRRALPRLQGTAERLRHPAAGAGGVAGEPTRSWSRSCSR